MAELSKLLSLAAALFSFLYFASAVGSMSWRIDAPAIMVASR